MKRSVQNRALARRYGAALVQTLGEDAAVRAALDELTAVEAVIDQSDDLSRVLSNPAFAAQRADVVSAVTERMGLSAAVGRFVALLAERDRVLILGDVLDVLRDLLSERAGRTRVEVVSAAALNDPQVQTLVERLAALLKRDAAAIDVTVKVDPSIWGGLKAKIGSKVYDASLRTQLDQVAGALRKEF